jgi:hypothetical protein
MWIKIRRGCCELDIVALSIEICWFAGQLDQVQKHLLDHLPFHHHFSYYIVFTLLNYVIYFFPLLFAKDQAYIQFGTVWVI